MKVIKRKYKDKVIVELLSLIPKIDHYCKVCFTKEDLSVHHIHKKADGGDEQLSNLIVLCEKHHSLLHNRHHKDHMKVYDLYKAIINLRRARVNFDKE